MSPRPQPRPNKEGGPKRERQEEERQEEERQEEERQEEERQEEERQEEERQEEERQVDSLLENISYINEFINQLIECYVQLGLGFGFRGTRQEIITEIAQNYNLLKDFSLLLNLHNIFKIFKIDIDTSEEGIQEKERQEEEIQEEIVRETSLAFDVEKFKNKTPEEIIKEVKISILKLVLFIVFFYFNSKKVQLNPKISAEVSKFFTIFKNLISYLLKRNFWKPTNSFEILNRAFSIDNVLDLIEKAIISITIRSWLYYFLEFYRTVIKGNPGLDLEEVIKDFYGNEKFVILLRFLLLREESGNEIVIYSPLRNFSIELKNFELSPNYLEINLEDIKSSVLQLTRWLIFEQEWSIDPNQITSNLFELESIRRILYTLLVRLEDITSINELQRKIEIPDISIQIFINNLKNLGLEIAQQKIRRPISLFYIKQLLEKPII